MHKPRLEKPKGFLGRPNLRDLSWSGEKGRLQVGKDDPISDLPGFDPQIGPILEPSHGMSSSHKPS